MLMAHACLSNTTNRFLWDFLRSATETETLDYHSILLKDCPIQRPLRSLPWLCWDKNVSMRRECLKYRIPTDVWIVEPLHQCRGAIVGSNGPTFTTFCSRNVGESTCPRCCFINNQYFVINLAYRSVVDVLSVAWVKSWRRVFLLFEPMLPPSAPIPPFVAFPPSPVSDNNKKSF